MRALITNRQSASGFFAGLLVGGLIATVGFAMLVRRRSESFGQQQTIVLKLGHGLDQNHPVHAAMVKMAERLAQLSQGSVKLQIFPNGQLGAEPQLLEQVQRGALAMTKTSAAPLEGFVPEMAIFSVPYVFRDDDHYWKIINGPIGSELLRLGERVGLRGLCYYDAGSRSFYSTSQAIRSPDDLRGMKIRVQTSKTAMDTIEVLGGSPTPIAWGELFTALQQKLVDAAENNPPTFVSSRHFEICKFLCLDEHTRVPDILVISQQVWEGLPSNVQAWVQQAADESSLFQKELWQRESIKAVETAEREGVNVVRPDKKPFVERVARLHNELAGTPIGELLQKIKSQ